METIHHKNFIIDIYDELTSTNDVVFDLAKKNQLNDKHVIVAKSQTNGHGRYSRKWTSEKGNLFFSILLRPSVAIKDPSLLSFVAAVSLSETLKCENIYHKWPNDILINEKKVAGILLKSSGNPENPDFIVIGIGVNITSNPSNTVFAATNLKSENYQNLDANDILKNFLNNFDNFYNKYQTFGFEAIRNLWLKKAFKLGKAIVVNLESQKITAKFKDLNNSGNLILEGENNDIKIVSTAEIFN